MVTISSALSEVTAIFRENNIDTPRLDAEIILAHILNCSRLKIMISGQENLSGEQYDEFNRLTDCRINGMPVSYITGHKEFMGLDFLVGPGVLVPRGDSEVAVEKVIAKCSKIQGAASVADVGCGSGAIGISIAKYAANAQVKMIDISDEALNFSRKNIELNGVECRVSAVKGDLLQACLHDRFNIIVSNPPYIESDVIHSLQKEVRDFEPLLALDGGPDGLEFYRRLVPQAAICLEIGGILILEIGYNQYEDVNKILLENNFKEIEVLKDLGGRDRCMIANKY